MTSRKDSEKTEARIEVVSPADTGSGADATPASVSPEGAFAERSVEEQLKKLQAEKDELFNTLVRRQADFENYRKRIERERHQERSRSLEPLVEKLLPVLDAFDRALAAHDDPAYEEYRKGVALIQKQLWDTLARQGLEPIEAVGKKFDPHLHHAIEKVESAEHPDGAITAVLQQGYRFHDKVLRPAMVRVAVHPAPVAPESASKED